MGLPKVKFDTNPLPNLLGKGLVQPPTEPPRTTELVYYSIHATIVAWTIPLFQHTPPSEERFSPLGQVIDFIEPFLVFFVALKSVNLTVTSDTSFVRMACTP